jgi:hypothetical protein
VSRPRPLTDSERATIVQLYRDGLSVDLIASEVRRGHPFVRQVLRDSGMRIQPRGGKRSREERVAIINRCKLWNNVDRGKGRPQSGYNREAEIDEAARVEAVGEATQIPAWMLALPASDRSIEDLCG